MALFVMALILTLVLVVQYQVYKNFGLNDIEYKLSLSRTEAFENEEIELTEEIINNKWLPLPWARSEICCSRWLSFYGGSQSVGKDAQKGLVSGVFMLKGHQRLKRVWRVRCEKRGVFRIEDVTLAVSDLFGLVKPLAMYKLNEEICVLPSPCEMEQPALSSEAFIGSNTVRRFILPDPFMICGAKEYTGREAMNRIHWGATARTGELMVYNNEFTTERRMLVILNMQRIFADETQRLPISLVEAHIKAAAFVLDQCYRSHISVGFAINAAERIFTEPAEGYEHTVNILRSLARLKNRCGCHIDEFVNSIDCSEYTDVLLISNILTDRCAEFMRSLQAQGIYTALLSNEIDETGFCDVYHVPRTRSYPAESGDDYE